MGPEITSFLLNGNPGTQTYNCLLSSINALLAWEKEPPLTGSSYFPSQILFPKQSELLNPFQTKIDLSHVGTCVTAIPFKCNVCCWSLAIKILIIL